MDRILVLALVCLGCGLAAADIEVSFYNIMANTSMKQCNVSGALGPNTLGATVTMQDTYHSAQISVPVSNNHVGLTQVWANITGSYKGIKVKLNVTAMKQSNSETWNSGGSDSQWTKYVGKTFSNLILRKTNASSGTNSTKACLDLAVAYEVGNSTRNVTAVGMGCWSFVNNSLTVKEDIKSNIKSWVQSLNNKLCNGALSSLQPASIFTLLAASLVALLATRS